MNTKDFIDRLFSEYEETHALLDFKEELRSNLDDRIAALQARGMDAEAAFYKATSELGDISSLADEISLKKKQEVFESVYMKTRNYISNQRMAAYLTFGGIFLFGIMSGLLRFLNHGVLALAVSSAMPFLLGSVFAFVFLGLTQETARSEAMSARRALAYAFAVLVFLFGIFLFARGFFFHLISLSSAIATLIPFCLPSALFLAFLILTEKNRHKPWVKQEEETIMKQYEERFKDPETAAKYGLVCGALWIFTIALFFALSFWIGFRYSWIIFLFAVGVQLIVDYFYHSKKPVS